MKAPLCEINSINHDFDQVESFLKKTKIPYFGVNVTSSVILFWNGENLTRYDSIRGNLPLTETDKAIFNRHFPEILREAGKVYEEYIKTNTK